MSIFMLVMKIYQYEIFKKTYCHRKTDISHFEKHINENKAHFIGKSINAGLLSSNK
jgi:hypothetical protein